MRTDRELLELAAKAAGIEISDWHGGACWIYTPNGSVDIWNPLTDDGDALRLAVKLNLSADFFDDFMRVGYTANDNECEQVDEPSTPDSYAAARRAIVRAAAAIGEAM